MSDDSGIAPPPNAEQAAVLAHVLQGENVMITGSAGTGKSFLINHICKEFDAQGVIYSVLAPTGVAALNVSGQTIHRFLGLRPDIRTKNDYVTKIYKRSKVPWATLRVLIIDEVSMIHPNLFILFDEICRLHNRHGKPFGGIQLILLGDYFQLSPIPEKDEPANAPKYIFETEVWKALNIRVHVLRNVMRQNEQDFIAALNDLRVGIYSEKVKAMIARCGTNVKQEGKHYVKLYSLNAQKNEANMKALKELCTEARTYRALDIGDEKYLQGCRAEKEITLKIGCPVMMLWNLPDQGLCNGSIGVITHYDEVGLPVVKFNSGVISSIKKQTWSVQEKVASGSRVIASRTQVPLAIAWSITSHKAQGLTLCHVEVDLRGVFTAGQMYVMLSRAANSKGLIVTGFKRRAIMVDDIVTQFYLTNNPIEKLGDGDDEGGDELRIL